MTDPSVLLAASVFLPLAAALLGFGRASRGAAVVGMLGSVLTLGVVSGLVVAVAVGGPVRHAMADWPAPLGISLQADGLGVVFLALTAVVGTVVSWYAGADERVTGEPRSFWPLWMLSWAGLNAVFVSGDLFNMYVSLEVLGLAAVGLVGLGGKASWAPALRYLFVAVLGSLLFLVAIAMVYASTGTLDVAQAGSRLAVSSADHPSETRSAWPMALAIVGLSLKTALVPFHAWLPPAHAAAPVAVSPVLSALVVKAAFFVLMRMWFDVAGPAQGLAVLLGVLGTAAVLWGGLMALRQQRLKRIVAYSTVAQIGYLFLIFPLTTFATSPEAARAAWTGGVAMALAHGLSKAALFLGVGSLMVGSGTDDLDGVRGLSREAPMIVLSMAIASVSLVGLPVSLGFSAKWGLLVAATGIGHWWWVVVIIVGSLLAGWYLLRPIEAVLNGSNDPGTPERTQAFQALPGRFHWLPLVLALATFMLGLSAADLMELSTVGSIWQVGR